MYNAGHKGTARQHRLKKTDSKHYGNINKPVGILEKPSMRTKWGYLLVDQNNKKKMEKCVYC